MINSPTSTWCNGATDSHHSWGSSEMWDEIVIWMCCGSWYCDIFDIFINCWCKQLTAFQYFAQINPWTTASLSNECMNRISTFNNPNHVLCSDLRNSPVPLVVLSYLEVLTWKIYSNISPSICSRGMYIINNIRLSFCIKSLLKAPNHSRSSIRAKISMTDMIYITAMFSE